MSYILIIYIQLFVLINYSKFSLKSCVKRCSQRSHHQRYCWYFSWGNFFHALQQNFSCFPVLVWDKSFFKSHVNHCTVFYSHAALRFKTNERAAEVLKLTDLKIAGKKVYVYPCSMELLHEFPRLGEPEIVEESGNGAQVKEVYYWL